MGLRFYIDTDDGLRRMSLKVLERQSALPQFSGTSRKMVQVVTERKNGQLLFSAHGSYVQFSKDGYLEVSLETMRTAAQLVDAAQAIERQRLNNPKVAHVGMHRTHRQLRTELLWEPSDAQRRAIADDVLGSQRPEGTSAIALLRPSTAPHRAPDGDGAFTP